MIHKFAEHEAALGSTIEKLERLTIFEYERERLINDNAFEELYPRSDATMARYQGHLALLEPSDETAVAVHLHQVFLKWLRWYVRSHYHRDPPLSLSPHKNHSQHPPPTTDTQRQVRSERVPPQNEDGDVISGGVLYLLDV